MNAWKIVCATLVIFLAGIITGATLVRVAQGRPGARWMQRPGGDNRSQLNPARPANQFNANPALPNPLGQRQPNQPPPPGGQMPGPLSREFIQVLEHRLQLSPEQRTQVDKIMADGQERMRELRSRIDPEMRKEFQQTREQIRAVLTPEQREQFEQLMKRPPRRGERGEPPERRFRDQREPGHPPPVEGEPRDSQPDSPPPN